MSPSDGLATSQAASIGMARAAVAVGDSRAHPEPTYEMVSREAAGWPVFLRLLGSFDVLKQGQRVGVRGGGRTESLLVTLAMRYRQRLPRDLVLGAVWPDSEPALAGQALNSLVHNLHRLLGDALGGEPPVVCIQGAYQLNLAAGVGLDIDRFESLAAAGDQETRGSMAAIQLYRRAILLYEGDLCAGNDQHALIERERLRARYLTLLSRLAAMYHAAGDIDACMAMALRLLENDPCREDAHRLVMRCHVLSGERSQAMRQYRICCRVLREEFEAEPEPDTQALYQQIRLNPSSI